MSQFSFSPHPVYRNVRWPDSYLIHPLSTVPVKPECQVECTSYFSFLGKRNNPPTKISDGMQPPPNTDLSSYLDLESFLSVAVETAIAPTPRTEGTVAQRVSAIIERDRRIETLSPSPKQ